MPIKNHEYHSFKTNNFKFAGLIILCIRFVQGWIFWGGGSRRFIYAPSKLDPYASQWMANKLQSAVPGALLGVGQIVNYLLQHFILLYIAIIIFSLVELIAGLCLIVGFMTRMSAFITAFISIMLMLLFGWQGATCMDEWTMAVATLSMGLTLTLSGSPIYSVDYLLLHRHPQLAQKNWFIVLGSGEWSYKILKRVSLIFLFFAAIFTLGTYNYYRGAILTRYHSGPVSPSEHHLTLSEGQLGTDGSVTFTAYVDAGTAALPSNIIHIELVDGKGKIIENWTGKELSQLPMSNVANMYLYNRFYTGEYGLVAPMSAKAKITLSPVNKTLQLSPGTYQLQVYTINGKRWVLFLRR